MSKEISLEEIKKFWPEKAPDINIVQKYVSKYEKEKIVIKYGGNVLIDRKVFNNFISDIDVLNKLGLSIIVVHGGGPRIKRELDKSNIQSKFIRGLRVTDEKIINIVESVLIDFNNDIVSSLKKIGSQAISINTKENNIIQNYFLEMIDIDSTLKTLEHKNIVFPSTPYKYFFKTEKGYGHFNFYGHQYFSSEISTFLELSYPQITSN